MVVKTEKACHLRPSRSLSLTPSHTDTPVNPTLPWTTEATVLLGINSNSEESAFVEADPAGSELTTPLSPNSCLSWTGIPPPAFRFGVTERERRVVDEMVKPPAVLVRMLWAAPSYKHTQGVDNSGKDIKRVNCQSTEDRGPLNTRHKLRYGTGVWSRMIASDNEGSRIDQILYLPPCRLRSLMLILPRRYREERWCHWTTPVDTMKRSGVERAKVGGAAKDGGDRLGISYPQEEGSPMDLGNGGWKKRNPRRNRDGDVDWSEGVPTNHGHGAGLTDSRKDSVDWHSKGTASRGNPP
ncbi:hypothetical protein BDN72DRAFT_859957 [Pluteus cervinus]|uniref:Uncharacterized protein n=1 Tax=Pluteus cervinus TaxID=181527 RepID=A0ACD3AKW3_9AGAR|nr:hypothetical protein BDN72DRAFT_859957 [Pluteus cervinus]